MPARPARASRARSTGGAGGVSDDCDSNAGGAGSASGDPVEGGDGGAGGSSDCPSACPLVNSDGISGGTAGAPGGNGVDGTGGSAAADVFGSFSGGLWTGALGVAGTRGMHGTGGGGGGSGGSKRFRACFGCNTLLGGNGGSGGPGGCGGGGGGPGGAGGGSFAIVTDSTVTLDSLNVVGGKGGAGGVGGAGVSGQTGASAPDDGGVPGAAAEQKCGLIDYESGAGAAGGAGGAGGSGGGGAGGVGGPSVAVVTVGAGHITQYGSTITMGTPGSGGAPGAGGGVGAVGFDRRSGDGPRVLRKPLESRSMKSYDYVVIGAGSAGCVIAHRLARGSGTRRCSSSTPGSSDSSALFRRPGMLALIYQVPKLKEKSDWGYRTYAQRNMDGRQMPWTRSKITGGCSSVNGMLYIRGNRDNYDGWRDLGNPGWGYDDVLPYFKKSERHEDGESEYHGGSGPPRRHAPARRERRLAGVRRERSRRSAASRVLEDFNGATQEGASTYQMTCANRRRSSTSVAFLYPALAWTNVSSSPRRSSPASCVERGRARGRCDS